MRIVGITWLLGVTACQPAVTQAPFAGGGGAGGGGVGVVAGPGGTGGAGSAGTAGRPGGGPAGGAAGGGGAGGEQACARVQVSASPIQPIVMLLIDQSGSMTADFQGKTRWRAQLDALADPATGVATELQERVILGAALYKSDNGSQGGTCPILTTLAPAARNAAAIGALLTNNQPGGDTPTGEAISAVTASLEGLPANVDSPLAPRIIVLATDGEPDTCAEPNPQNGQPQSIAAAEAAFARGIRTFVLGVGDEVGAAHLQDLADAGAGVPRGGAMRAPFYQVNNTAELARAFDTIIRGVRTCRFALQGRVDPASAGGGTVKLNGQLIPYGQADGWTVVDPGTIELQGAACRTFLETDQVSLEAEFPCEAVIG